MSEAEISAAPITPEEMFSLFGSYMPIEAVRLIWECPGDWTLADVRREIRKLAKNHPRQNGNG
jgi:hypothetical protein